MEFHDKRIFDTTFEPSPWTSVYKPVLASRASDDAGPAKRMNRVRENQAQAIVCLVKPGQHTRFFHRMEDFSIQSLIP
jgi:hypothetical protein